MRKRIYFAAALALAMVTFTNCSKEKNDSIENGQNSIENTIEEWVDLGLPSGLLWCSHNVGAEYPENYGNYYAWGETTAKDRYSWLTYRYINNENSQMKLTKYCNNSNYGHNGFTDNLIVLEPEDDAATVNMGDSTRTPTIEEWMELINNTTSTWTKENGVNGRTFKAANGNSIFLPAAGYYEGTSTWSVQSRGIYWSASLDEETSPRNAQAFDFSPNRQEKAIYYRSSGFAVRAVCERKK